MTTQNALDVLHAWLVEDLPDGRVLKGHQAWLDGLVEAASGGPERYGR
ncbi:hypothetical protein [Streptomyces sp. WAC 01529]|nr:hypothetical protein [Streptomyces sp. WAC 01529]